MLTRIISALVGVVIVLVGLFMHNTILMPVMVAAVIGIMMFELLRAVKLEKCIPILISAELCGIATPIIHWHWYVDTANANALSNLYIKSSNMVVFGVILVCSFAIFITWLKKHKEIQYSQVFFTLACMILVPNSMSTIIDLNGISATHGVFLIFMGLCGAWIADSGAYFTGVAIGKHKLCPEISPKKTVEGFIGGIVSTAVVFMLAFFIYNQFITSDPIKLDFVRYALLAIAGSVCAVIGTVGDLSASMVKRQIGFKDYGKIMPGHGGMMDRFDSVLFVLPTFYAFIVYTDILSHS